MSAHCCIKLDIFINIIATCNVCGRGEIYIQGIGGGDLREIDHLGYPGVDGRIIIRWIFRKWDMRAWTGSI